MDNYYIKRNDPVQLKKIILLEAMENYTLFHLQGGQKLISSSTLKKHEAVLAEETFLRVNRSMMINPMYVKKVTCKDQTNYIKMKDGREIKVSRRRRDTLALLAS